MLRLRISWMSFHCGFPAPCLAVGYAATLMGELSSTAGNVGLPWPIISRGRICLIYYIHCVIHRKRLPTLYCGQDGRGVELNRDGNTRIEKGAKERGRTTETQKGGFAQTHKWQLLISSRDNSTRAWIVPRYQRFNCLLMDNRSVLQLTPEYTDHRIALWLNVPPCWCFLTSTPVEWKVRHEFN